MEALVEKKVTITLFLSEKEARILNVIVQSPVCAALAKFDEVHRVQEDIIFELEKCLEDSSRPTVGDVVRLLPGGAEGTRCDPPLIEGNLYIIQADDKSTVPYQLQTGGSWVQRESIELVMKGNNNDQN